MIVRMCLATVAVLLTSCLGAAAQAVLPAAVSPVVSTVSALTAMPISNTTPGVVYVRSYNRPGDEGGGVFQWMPSATATPDNCTIFGASGVTTGRWYRQLNGGPLNVDMCGASATGDSSTAFGYAFKLCTGSALQVVMSAHYYKFAHNLTLPPGCSLLGAPSTGNGGSNTVLDFTYDTDGGTCLTIAGTTYGGGYAAGNEVGRFTMIGNASGVGSKASCTQGIYVSRVTEEYLHDVHIMSFNGPCLFWGQTVLAYMDRVSVSGCGSPTTAEIEIYGEVLPNGGEYVGTTLFIRGLDAGSDNGNQAQAAVKIDRWGILEIDGGSFENAGIPLMVATKPSAQMGVGVLTVRNIDLENPTNGASNCAVFGTGWTGAPGKAVTDSRFQDNTCAADATPITAHLAIQNSTNLNVTNVVFQSPNAGAVVLDFQGTGNFHQSASLNDITLAPSPPSYVRVDGTVLAGADPVLAWSIDNAPGPVANLPVCGSATLGRSLYVTDSAQTLNAGLGQPVAGGGSNAVRVGCDGKVWRIGG